MLLPTISSPEPAPSVGGAGADVEDPELSSVLCPSHSVVIEAETGGVAMESAAGPVSVVDAVATEAVQLVFRHCCGSVCVM